MFTTEDRERISAAVKAAEKKTSGEIVPVVVPASDAYLWVHFAWVLVGVILGSLVAYGLHLRWPITLREFVWLQVTGAVLSALFSLIPLVKRWSIPRSWREQEVHETALATFLTQGLHSTRGRTGILIFISQFEHEVEILADKGINSIVGAGYWTMQSDAIAKGIKNRRAAEALTEVIGNVGALLAEHFPRTAEDKNELEDHLRSE